MTTDLIELKAHECFNQSTLATGLLTHDEDGRGIERLLEVLFSSNSSRSDNTGPHENKALQRKSTPDGSRIVVVVVVVEVDVINPLT